MRRFIVLFLLFVLPIQVLAESLADLPTVPHTAATTEVAETATSTDKSIFKSTSFFPDKPQGQQAVHADLSDSVNSAELYVHSPLLFEQWPSYSAQTSPLAYPPRRKPPRI
ncbi:hypothetical protein ACLPHM_02635 [Paenalcaligenes sp. Me131]|uniref:hypothetical protein n=1 Tax=Paenalcaligenes sp. Me131 TaxID=3392636 RepID=UPI003D265E73